MSDHPESPIEPELEARIVALALGEASAFEQAELERLIADRPELILFRQRIESLHGMLREIGGGEKSEPGPWKLPRAKRAAIMEKIVAPVERKTASSRRRSPWDAVAAIAVAAIFLAGLLFVVRHSASPGEKGNQARPTDLAFSDDNLPETRRRSLLSRESESRREQQAAESDADDFIQSQRLPGGAPPKSAASPSAQPEPTAAAENSPFLASRADERRENRIPAPAETLPELSELAKDRDLSFKTAPQGSAVGGGLPGKAETDESGKKLPQRSLPSPPLAAPLSRSSSLAANENGRTEAIEGFQSGIDRLERIPHPPSRRLAQSNELPENAEPGQVSKKLAELRPLDEFSQSPAPAPTALPLEKDANKPAALAAEKSASAEPFSTFSLHVSDVSFRLAVASLQKNQWPDPARIRIEDFVNAFDYGDPLPTPRERVAAAIEQAIAPGMQQRNLLRIALRTAAAGRDAQTPLRLTLLLDSSGSMDRFDRQETLLRALSLLAAQLCEEDRVTLISFARQPRLLADALPGNRCQELLQMVASLPREGGTNLESALRLAHSKALEMRRAGAVSRIILLTDGAANLGDANPERIAALVETMRESGTAFDAAGIGAEGLNDEILEALTRKGDGRYYLLDRPEDVGSQFASQIAGALRPSAKNVKVQVEFNPLRVGRYRLHGFENHLLNREDFRDDQVDAAEMSAAEAGVALYQVEPLPEGEGDLGVVSVRFRDMDSGEMVEKSWPIPFQPSPPPLSQASESLRIAALAALAASKLKNEDLGQLNRWEDLRQLFGSLSPATQKKEPVARLGELIAKAIQLESKN